MLPRHDVLMTGVGGKGVLSAGQVLAQAGMACYKNVLWFPSYQAAMRGGPCECTVVLSDEEIASPVLTQAQTLVVMETSQLKPFEGRIVSGGWLILESFGFSGRVSRSDVCLVPVPAVEMAVKLGNSQVANFILLGAYLQLTQALPLRLVEVLMERRYQSNSKALEQNLEALRQGAEFTSTKAREVK